MEDTLQSVGFMNFGTVDLGDNRRTERLVALVDIMCRHPGGTLPDKLNRPADLRAFYRLMNRPEVTHTILIGGHAAATRERIAALPPGSAGHWATLARSLFDGMPCSNQLSYWHLRNGSKSPGQARARPLVSPGACWIRRTDSASRPKSLRCQCLRKARTKSELLPYEE